MKNGPLILIDAGHGHLIAGKYQTPGKRYVDQHVSLYEGVLNKAVAYNLALRLALRSIRSEIINPTNSDIELDTRCRKANEYDQKYSCFYLSIHHNAGGGHGCELYTSAGETPADEMAEIGARIFDAYFPHRKFRSSGIEKKMAKEARFRVLYKTKMPAVLTEFGFMDHAEDRKYIASDEGIRDQVRWLADWMEYLINTEKL